MGSGTNVNMLSKVTDVTKGELENQYNALALKWHLQTGRKNRILMRPFKRLLQPS